ncbi:alpha/beta-hydrolase [Aspergillus heteromorphus CBS 117.55]|uniref:Alpha/beta-hydrolase n=1 Tax=Aspergillus heteromorphus CBS 117.55 TaxID=1448321 RepID=A0A317V669_9EURO|nr:alpha/beta-hydrolase [Aspergillus heteromorphus CBS 117.55]PWY68392.1 alpha/beta-hydrolase [Aspergillus heteromorphus CBS 117.55]
MAPVIVVLVPGAWHQPACMDQLRDELGKLGLHSVAVAHPSIGSTLQPRPNLADDVASLHRTIKRLADEGHLVTAMAHSYGGVVASGAAKGLGVAERGAAGQAGGITMMVYLAAFAIPAGQSLLEAVGGVPPSWWDIRGDQVFGDSPVISNPAEMLYHDLPRPAQDYWISQLRPITTAVSELPNTYEPWKHLSCTYILTEQDRAIPLAAQEAMVAWMGEVTTARVNASHSPFLSMPGEVARLVQHAVQEGLQKLPAERKAEM